jgi:hypothetical protein
MRQTGTAGVSTSIGRVLKMLALGAYMSEA